MANSAQAVHTGSSRTKQELPLRGRHLEIENSGSLEVFMWLAVPHCLNDA
jgi:hypothetical protein